MGKHYIPRHYLNGFTDPTSSDKSIVWVYTRGSKRVFSSSTSSVANESDFYTAEIEQWLADEIEAPAMPVINAVRRGEALNLSQQILLARYISVLTLRVPQMRNIARNDLPDRSAAMLAQEFAKIDHSIELGVEDSEFQLAWREHLKESMDDGHWQPEKIWGRMLVNPDATHQMVGQLLRMSWRFFHVKDMYFVTSDNPVFWNPTYGLYHERAEMSLPISNTIVMSATWNMEWASSHVMINNPREAKKLVREFNRRTLRGATRYAFSQKKEDWITTLINRNPSQIRLYRLVPSQSKKQKH